MVEEITEAKDFDSKADEFLNKEETETPTDSSLEIKPEGEEVETPPTGAEPDKTEKVKEIEADESLSVEDKIAKVKEILGDDEKAIDAYIKEKGYHNDPAWIKQRELIDRLKKEGEAKSALSDEDRVLLDEFKTFRKSAEYIQTTMTAQGYKQEAIDKKLQDSGFEVDASPQDDMQLVADKLEIDLSTLTPNQRATLEDVSKVARILINDSLGKVLPKELAPFKKNLESMTQSKEASTMVATIKETIKRDGVLDYEKDIEPKLNKFLDDYPDATQPDILEHFKSINHALTIERLKTGNRKVVRDEKKSSLRQNLPISGSPEGLPTKTGDFDKDADALLDSLNIS